MKNRSPKSPNKEIWLGNARVPLSYRAGREIKHVKDLRHSHVIFEL
jgi:hypothetical protein